MEMWSKSESATTTQLTVNRQDGSRTSGGLLFCGDGRAQVMELPRRKRSAHRYDHSTRTGDIGRHLHLEIEHVPIVQDRSKRAMLQSKDQAKTQVRAQLE